MFFTLVEFFKQTIFSNLFLLKTLPSTGGWMGDHAHVCFIVKIIVNLNMCWEDRNMRYTFDIIVVSIGIIGFFQLVSILTFSLYTHILFLCMYAFNYNGINFNWYLIFIHIFFFAKLENLMIIIFQLISFQLVFIQAYASFYLVFHKGGENSYFIFQLVFCLPLVLYSTPTLYDEEWLKN